jgi:hypothetical protein
LFKIRNLRLNSPSQSNLPEYNQIFQKKINFIVFIFFKKLIYTIPMFLYILLFLNSCLSTPSRKISTIETKEDQYWYLGFDNRLEREDRDWSLKLYYSPALDNLRKFGAYKYAQENESRNYLKDNFNNNDNSLYPQLERLLLVLFPSPDGSLSITSNSLFNLNSFISKLPSKENEKDLLTKEIVLAKILNTIYTTLSFSNLKTTEEKITAIDLIKKDSLQQLNILFSKYCENNNQIHFDFKMIESLFNPVFNFMKKESINLEEKW